jgi:misacylated tRNA(Ala) deacylase
MGAKSRNSIFKIKRNRCFMTRALFLIDSYLKECQTTVVSVKDGKYVTLDQTVFYAKGGGQPNDTGKII